MGRLTQPGRKPILNNRMKHRSGRESVMASSEGLPRFEGLVEEDERIVATHFQEEQTRPMPTDDGLR